jgi:hypothetical protein
VLTSPADPLVAVPARYAGGVLSMKKTVAWILVHVICLAGVLALAPAVLKASDHADPVVLENPESNITGLFFFPKGDQMILIFNVRRALTAAGPFADITPIEFVVHMDLHGPVTFTDPSDLAHYGGTVTNPEGLKSDVTIKFKLTDDLKPQGGYPSFEGLTNSAAIRVFTGVRDDPFIFPRFFKKNVISMAMSIPMSSFPEGQKDWMLWGSTYKDGVQLDHVGRSNRSQLARFDTLNPLPPTEHVAEIMKLMASTGKLYNTLNSYAQTKAIAGLIQYVLLIRQYDVATDVMIYSNRFPPGFPNGRRLEDDIVGLTCATGDCILQELAFVEGKIDKGYPRPVINDKPFLDDFPYLAEPWPVAAEAAPPKSVFTPAFLMDIVGVLPELMRLGGQFVGMPVVITGLIAVPVGSWAVIQFLLFLVRKLTRRKRRPAMA